MARQGDDERLGFTRLAAQRARHLQTGLAAEEHVEHDHVGPVLASGGERVGDVGGGADRETGLAEIVAKREPDGGLIVDDEDSGAVAMRSSHCAIVQVTAGGIASSGCGRLGNHVISGDGVREVREESAPGSRT